MATLVEVDDDFGPVCVKDAGGLIRFMLEWDRLMTGRIRQRTALGPALAHKAFNAKYSGRRSSGRLPTSEPIAWKEGFVRLTSKTSGVQRAKLRIERNFIIANM